MNSLSKLWAGKAYGTNVGNLFVSFDETQPQVKGTLRFLDQLIGIAVYAVEGTFNETLTLTGKWQTGGKPEHHGVLTINGRLTSEGNLRGTWISTIGTGGTFDLFPHDVALSSAPSTANPSIPEQLYTRNVTVGAIRMYAQDVLALLRYVQEEFNAPRPIVTYHLRGNEVTKYAVDFEREVSTLGRLDYLKVTVQEPDEYGINRLVVVELNAFGKNEVRVQGIRESWVIGRAEALATVLRKNQSSLVTGYRKFGLNLNSLIFLAMLVLIPEIDTFWARVTFVGATIALLTLLLWAHSKFIPNASILLTGAKPNIFAKAWPTLLSWLVAASASLVAAMVFYWLTRSAS